MTEFRESEQTCLSQTCSELRVPRQLQQRSGVWSADSGTQSLNPLSTALCPGGKIALALSAS